MSFVEFAVAFGPVVFAVKVAQPGYLVEDEVPFKVPSICIEKDDLFENIYLFIYTIHLRRTICSPLLKVPSQELCETPTLKVALFLKINSKIMFF